MNSTGRDDGRGILMGRAGLEKCREDVRGRDGNGTRRVERVVDRSRTGCLVRIADVLTGGAR